ncbi:Importin subunit beta-1, partial [Cichlidogyrus casuarinus]
MTIDQALLAILQRSISPDKNELDAAQRYLEEAARSDLPHLMKLLSEILAEESCDQTVRMQAGLQLKNFLYTKDTSVKQELHSRWLSIPESDRQFVKDNSLNALATEKSGHSTAAQCVAYMACIELPQGQWGDMMPKLIDGVINEASSNRLRLAALEAIGYICQDIDPTILVVYSDGILTAIVHGIKQVDDLHVKLAATNALHNSLEFTKCNFENENERNYIMQVVCESTQHSDTKLSVAALQCLVKIMSLYYVYMEAYMSNALFPITVAAMESNIPEVALQGIEFWSSVCDEELDLYLEATSSSEQGRPPVMTSKYYAKGALAYIVPILMNVMTIQDENADEDEWNPNKAAGVCMMLLAQLTEDAIVPLVIPFVSTNVENANWRLRDAAIMAFGSILEGPKSLTLRPYVEQAMPLIIGLLKDPSVAVRDSSAWTISRVCEVLPDLVIQPQLIEQLLDGLLMGLRSEPRVASNACWAISSLSESAYDAAVKALPDPSQEPPTYCLSTYFEFITKALLDTCNRTDSSQNNLRGAAYTVLMDVLKFSARDCYPEVQRVTLEIISRLESMLGIEQQVSSQDRAQFNDLQSLLCGNLQSVLRKISPDDAPAISDK